MRDPVDVSTGEGSEKSGKRGRAKAAMPVRDEASERKRVEGEESNLGGWGEGRGGNGEKPKVRGGGFRASQERQGGGGGVVDGDRSRCKDGVTIRAEERGDAHKRM